MTEDSDEKLRHALHGEDENPNAPSVLTWVAIYCLLMIAVALAIIWIFKSAGL